MQTEAAPIPEQQPAVQRALWAGLLLLVCIGVGAAVHRTAFLNDAAVHIEPLRASLLTALRLSDPQEGGRAAQVALFDVHYAAHPVATLFHVLPGGFFLLLLPLQFIPAIRRRRPKVHRWLGRVLVVAATMATLPAMYFALRLPFGGMAETIVIGAVAAWLMIALARGVMAIRRGDVARHREWMIRAASVPLGVSTVRLVAAPLDLALLPLGLSTPRIFVLAIWIGWATTIAAAECWIQRTRPRAVPRLRAAHGHR